MRIVKASESKAKCLKLMDEVGDSGEPIVITKNGKPVAQLGHAVERPRMLRGLHKGKAGSWATSSRPLTSSGKRTDDPARYACLGLGLIRTA